MGQRTVRPLTKNGGGHIGQHACAEGEIGFQTKISIFDGFILIILYF